MRALKILVVVMGVLIVGGTLTLVALVVQRAGSSATHSGRSTGHSGPWEAALDQPEGSRIAGIASAEGALAVWVTRPDGERILLLDPRRGRVSGEIRLGR